MTLWNIKGNVTKVFELYSDLHPSTDFRNLYFTHPQVIKVNIAYIFGCGGGKQ